MDLTVKLLTASGGICTSVFNNLHAKLITFPRFVLCQCLIARNVAELLSSNGDVSNFYAAYCIDELSRGSIFGYKFS